MPAVLPPALEALLRMEGRQYPNAAEMEMIGMPMGVPFSNQNPGSGYRNVPSGTLNALTTMLSGLGAPMGYEQPAPPPDPRTMFIRPVLSPTMAAGKEPAYRHIGGMAEAGAEHDMLQDLLHRGGANLGQATVQGYQERAAKTGIGMGIGDQEKYAAWKQGMAGDEKSRRDLVNKRAMQVAQARTNRRSGMDPRTAALLAALGDDAGGLGGMVMADALLGRGSGLEMSRQQNDRELAEQAIATKNAGTMPVAPDLKTTAAKIYAEKLQANRGNKAKAANDALLEVMKTGVTEQEASAALAEVAGVETKDISSKPKKKTPLVGAYGGFTRQPEWGDVMEAAADSLGERIRNWDFWKTGMF